MREFSFSDRLAEINVFDVKICVTIGDTVERKLLDSSKLLAEAARLTDIDARLKKCREALNLLIGAPTAEQILSHAEIVDCFAITEVWRYVVGAYREAEAKKITASTR